MNLKLILCILFLVHIRGGKSMGSCYYVSTHGANWFDAMFECQKNNLCLADLDSKSKLDVLLSSINEDTYWTGLNCYEKLSWKFVSDVQRPVLLPLKTKLDVKDPCASIVTTERAFVSFPCNRRKKYICSDAPKCNGIPTEAVRIPAYSGDLPCEMSDEVRKIIGIPTVDKEL